MGKQGAYTPLSLHFGDKERTMIALRQVMNAHCASDDCLWQTMIARWASYECLRQVMNARCASDDCLWQTMIARWAS